MAKPIFIKHRVNTAAALTYADTAGGVEIDVRSNVHSPQSLHLSHDPWILGEDFGDWISTYSRLGFAGPLVINTKEDGLEENIIRYLKNANVDNFFFLDTAPPTLVRLLSQGLGAHMSLRISSWESTKSAEPWLSPSPSEHRPSWIWLDCFGGIPFPESDARALMLTQPSLKICLVSPELQHVPTSDLAGFEHLAQLSTAVCTKTPDLWISKWLRKDQ